MQNEQSNLTDVRLRRIRKISSLLKVCVLIYFLAPICYCLLYVLLFHPHVEGEPRGPISLFGDIYASANDVPPIILALSAISAGVYLWGVVAFYRLMGLYEKGIIFSTTNVLQMKRLGRSLIGFGIMSFAAKIIHTGGPAFPLILVQGISPLIIGGATINIIAWIMDEGRKIQEEQALTV